MDQTLPLSATRRRPVEQEKTSAAAQAPAVSRRLSSIQKILLWIYLFAFALDFKGNIKEGVQEGGSIFQYLFVAVCVLSGLGLYFQPRVQRASRGLKRLTHFWWAYLIITLLTVVLYNVGGGKAVLWGHYFRTIMPFFFCGMSLLVMQRLYQLRIHPAEIMKPLIIAGIVSSIWRIFYATRISGLQIDEMRFQILSPFTPLLLAVGIAGIFLERKPRPIAVVSFVVSAMTIIISVTRSYVITLAFCLLALGYLYFLDRKMVSLNHIIQKTLLLLIPFIVLQLTVIVRPQVIAWWEYRLFHQQARGQREDATFTTRKAEYSWMWNDINKDPLALLIGRGVGQDYRWDAKYRAQISRVMFWTGGAPKWFAGHSVWMYSIFSSGILVGSMIFVFFAIGIYQSFGLAKIYGRFKDPLLRQALLLPFLASLAYLSQTFTANPLGERGSGQILGLLFGMAFWFYDTARPTGTAAPKTLPVRPMRRTE